MSPEWRGVLNRSWNSEVPLVFAHVILTKMLGVLRSKEIRAWITRRMDHWECGLNVGLVGDAKTEGAKREDKTASVSEEEDDAVARSYHDIIFSGKLWKDVRQATDREERA